jgi:general nucleoside transport system permease protein
MDTVFIDGLSFALPLLVIAVGGIYSERSGITNLALEGFQGFGAFIGALAATLLSRSGAKDATTLMYASLLAAMFGGAVYSLLHALLCIKFKANQVISGVVVNILAVALTIFFTSQANSLIYGNASNKFMLSVSPRFSVPGLSAIPVIGALFMNMYPFELIILAVILVAWYLLYRTPYGMHLRACGENPHAFDAAGGDVLRTQFSAVLASGALSGLGGMCFAYSISTQFSPSIYAGYGYLAIAAMIFGNWSIVSTFAVCLLFGFAKSGSYKLCLNLGMSSNYSDLMLVLPYVLTLLLLVFFSKHNHPPKAAGEPFDRGKR